VSEPWIAARREAGVGGKEVFRAFVSFEADQETTFASTSAWGTKTISPIEVGREKEIDLIKAMRVTLSRDGSCIATLSAHSSSMFAWSRRACTPEIGILYYYTAIEIGASRGKPGRFRRGNMANELPPKKSHKSGAALVKRWQLACQSRANLAVKSLYQSLCKYLIYNNLYRFYDAVFSVNSWSGPAALPHLREKAFHSPPSAGMHPADRFLGGLESASGGCSGCLPSLAP
jgi:hypothetical protein